jgi:hypothetical protein
MRQDNGVGAEAVAKSVHTGGLFTCAGARSCGALGIAAVGGGLERGGHRIFLPVRSEHMGSAAEGGSGGKVLTEREKKA